MTLTTTYILHMKFCSCQPQHLQIVWIKSNGSKTSNLNPIYIHIYLYMHTPRSPSIQNCDWFQLNDNHIWPCWDYFRPLLFTWLNESCSSCWIISREITHNHSTRSIRQHLLKSSVGRVHPGTAKCRILTPLVCIDISRRCLWSLIFDERAVVGIWKRKTKP